MTTGSTEGAENANHERTRLRALWDVSPVEVRVLFGALKKAPQRGAFLSRDAAETRFGKRPREKPCEKGPCNRDRAAVLSRAGHAHLDPRRVAHRDRAMRDPGRISDSTSSGGWLPRSVPPAGGPILRRAVQPTRRSPNDRRERERVQQLIEAKLRRARNR
jgi:hypothetical protein